MKLLLVCAAFLAAPSTTWHEGCPVPLSELRELKIAYIDYDGRQAEGKLVVHKDVAEEVKIIFDGLYRSGFRIASMRPMEEFGGNDELSMEFNNTLAFNCRDITGQKGKFSNHSWGRAIDINPLTNPYVKGRQVLPPGGRAYLDRSRSYTGGIVENGVAFELFRSYGWTWGGDWKDLNDYQHFEKPAQAKAD